MMTQLHHFLNKVLSMFVEPLMPVTLVFALVPSIGDLADAAL